MKPGGRNVLISHFQHYPKLNYRTIHGEKYLLKKNIRQIITTSYSSKYVRYKWVPIQWGKLTDISNGSIVVLPLKGEVVRSLVIIFNKRHKDLRRKRSLKIRCKV